MDCLIRPTSARMLTGVAAGIAELYGLSVTIVPLLFIAAFFAQPLVLLIYLLLAISMPSEDNVITQLRLHSSLGSSRDRFEQLSDLLIRRNLRVRSRISPQTVAFVTVAIAAILEIPRLEGIDFYSAHPVIASFASIASRFGTVLFDLAIAFAFFLPSARNTLKPALIISTGDRVELQETPWKSVGGLAAGIARVILVDPAYIRVAFILLNLFTFGIAGVIYLIVVIVLRKRAGGNGSNARSIGERESENYSARKFRPIIASLFIGLAALRVCTEFRLFFFNEPFFQGLAYIALGLLFAIRGISANKISAPLWFMGGAAVLLVGVESFCSSVFRVQLTLPARFEIAYIIAALSLIYYSILQLEGPRRTTAIVLAGVVVGAALIIEAHIIPARFLLALIQFYDFFFPLIFGGLGVWLVMER